MSEKGGRTRERSVTASVMNARNKLKTSDLKGGGGVSLKYRR